MIEVKLYISDERQLLDIAQRLGDIAELRSNGRVIVGIDPTLSEAEQAQARAALAARSNVIPMGGRR